LDIMDYKLILPAVISFLISVIVSPVIIPFLTKLKFGQHIREEGPSWHEKKSGTPTMGGLIFLGSTVITALIFIKGNPDIIPVLFVTLGFGLIGFLDDYIKVVMKRNLGLRAWQKMGLQLLVTGVFCYYIMRFTEVGTKIYVPFVKDLTVDMSWLYIPFVFFVVLGSVNGVNLTDGLDGLAASVTVMVATFFTVVAIGFGSSVYPITAAVVGSLLGFLMFNVYPAKVFMGDTGSLALGGFVAATAIVLRMPLFILIVGFIYVAETVSVMLQVGYFKLTHGKRLFKMAPIHHHFEMCGWAETRVVAVFSIITAILCMLALINI